MEEDLVSAFDDYWSVFSEYSDLLLVKEIHFKYNEFEISHLIREKNSSSRSAAAFDHGVENNEPSHSCSKTAKPSKTNKKTRESSRKPVLNVLNEETLNKRIVNSNEEIDNFHSTPSEPTLPKKRGRPRKNLITKSSPPLTRGRKRLNSNSSQESIPPEKSTEIKRNVGRKKTKK